MASIRKRGDKWQAIVRMKGSPATSGTFPTKKEAAEWAAAEESAIRAGRRGAFPPKTLDQALTRYELEVSRHKRGKRAESMRFEAMRRDFPSLVAKVMHKITAADLSAWRDARLRVVSKGSVQRDINLFRNVWTVAAKEWQWCADPSPWRNLRMPGDNPARQRIVGWREARALLRRMGYRTGRPPTTKSEELAYLFLLGMQTCMRTSEMLGLTVDTLDLQARVARLDTHKTLEKAGVRFVPLPRRSARALGILAANATKGRLFTISAGSADALFRKYMAQLMITGLTFRDTRATGATLLARRTDPLTLSRVLGHMNLRELSDVYYRERPEQIAARI